PGGMRDQFPCTPRRGDLGCLALWYTNGAPPRTADLVRSLCAAPVPPLSIDKRRARSDPEWIALRPSRGPVRELGVLASLPSAAPPKQAQVHTDAVAQLPPPTRPTLLRMRDPFRRPL